MGIVADGLLRTDADRPPEQRMPIPDFDPMAPDLEQTVSAARRGDRGIAVRRVFLRVSTLFQAQENDDEALEQAGLYRRSASVVCQKLIV